MIPPAGSRASYDVLAVMVGLNEVLLRPVLLPVLLPELLPVLLPALLCLFVEADTKPLPDGATVTDRDPLLPLAVGAGVIVADAVSAILTLGFIKQACGRSY